MICYFSIHRFREMNYWTQTNPKNENSIRTKFEDLQAQVDSCPVF